MLVIWRNWNPLKLLVGMENDTATLKKSLAVVQNVKYRVTMWPRNSTPGYIIKRIDNICPHRILYSNMKLVYSSVIHNSPKMETIQMSINWWKDIQNVVPLYGILFSHKKGMNNQYMLQHGWTLKTLCQVKEARYKRPHIV